MTVSDTYFLYETLLKRNIPIRNMPTGKLPTEKEDKSETLTSTSREPPALGLRKANYKPKQLNYIRIIRRTVTFYLANQFF